MKKVCAITFCISVVTMGILAASGDQNPQKSKAITENKNITIIHGEASADGKSVVREQVLEECIKALPGTGDLSPQITSQAQFLKEINGDPNKNDFLKTYTAFLEINYMLYQKVLFIVTTNSVNAQEPIMKEMEKSIKQSKTFESNPSEGDVYAGRSNRQYYYSTAEAAANDVKERARIWLKEQAAVVCEPKTR